MNKKPVDILPKKKGGPTKSHRKINVVKAEAKRKAKEDAKKEYDKLTDMEKALYDLKQTNKHEKAVRIGIRKKGYRTKKITHVLDDVVEKYNPRIRLIENKSKKGPDLISIRIDENKFSNQFFTPQSIINITHKISDKLKKKNINGQIMASVEYGDLSWKSGYFRDFGIAPKIYDPNELYNLEVAYDVPKSIPSFNIYIKLSPKAEGGADNKFNDCLYNCLKYFVFDIEDYYKSACDFKTQLGLGRSDLVPIECLEQIEKKLKTYQINVRGQEVRSSTIKSNKQINLIYANKHFEIEQLARRPFNPFIKYEEKTPILYNNKTFEAYDGNRKWTFENKQERNKIMYDIKSPYILVQTAKPVRNKTTGLMETLPIEEEYQQFIKTADVLKRESKGMINLYKTGNLYSTALSLFDRLTKFINPEQILQDEAIWIKASSFSALIWAEEYEGELFQYDIKSLYPYLMMSSTLKFPVKRGEFRIIEDFNKEFFEYGIYRCVIKQSNDPNINKLFKFKHEHYTSIDLNNAKNLGLEIELIQDGKANFLYYSGDKTIKFCEVFKLFINILFPIKDNKDIQEKYIIANTKKILNLLWGALSESDKRKQYIQNTFSIDDDEDIDELYPSGDNEDTHIIKTTKFNNYYKTAFARLCPFLISQGRKHMADIMFEHREHIHRISTDGFLSSKCIHTNEDIKLGQLKYEGFTPHGVIINCCNLVMLSK